MYLEWDETEMKSFPDCFPKDFATDILPAGAVEEDKTVYRVIKYGILNRDSYVGTYEEIIKGLMLPGRRELDLSKPGTYSTSCYLKKSELEYFLKLCMRHHPAAFIAKGTTAADCGPSQLTSDREPRDDTHVDWWIYKDAEPQSYFEEVLENE